MALETLPRQFFVSQFYLILYFLDICSFWPWILCGDMEKLNKISRHQNSGLKNVKPALKKLSNHYFSIGSHTENVINKLILNFFRWKVRNLFS